MSSSLSPERAEELDAVFMLLADARRRVIIETVYDAGSIDIGELAVTIARREYGQPISVDDHIVEEITVDLHHRHLPQLRGHNVVDVDHNEGRISPTAQTRRWVEVVHYVANRVLE